jgi:hypothetical protein
MTQRTSHFRSRARPAVAAIAAIAAIASVGVTGAGPAIAAGSACDVATAQALVTPDGPNPQEHVTSVACDAFLGPSRPAMLVLIRPQCGCVSNVGGWEVFGLVDGAWAPSTDGMHDPEGNVTVSGSSVIEMRTIRRRDDWFGLSGRTGGTQTRTWAWDGAAGMAATPWVQVQPPQAPGVVLLEPRTHDNTRVKEFFQIGNRILCEVEDDHVSRALCTHFGDTSVTASFGPRRAVRVCRTSATRRCALAEVPTAFQPPNVLHAGQSVIIGRFTCRAGAVRCTLASGRGFTVGSRGARRLG